MLKIQNLSKIYKNNVVAVQDFNFSIQPQELKGIAGPNGSGKTSIINCILGIYSATTGKVELNGYANNSIEFKSNISYVPDDLILPDALTANEYFDFVASMYKQNTQIKKEKLIEVYDMGHALNQPIETYSHGMKKKTQLIAAYMLDTNLVILDEPFRGLDIEAIIITKKLMNKHLENGGSILLSTHDLLAAEKLCTRITILLKGKKVAEGTVQQLLKEHQCSNLEEVFMKVSMLGERSTRFGEIIANF